MSESMNSLQEEPLGEKKINDFFQTREREKLGK